MEKISKLLNYLAECDSHKKFKNNVVSKSLLEKYSYYLIRVGLGLYVFIFIAGLIYKFIYSSELLRLSVLFLEIIALISFILGMLFQIVPVMVNIKNFKKESQKLLIKNVEHNERIVNVLSKYDKETLNDLKEHIQIKINSNTSKNHLVIGQNVTVIFLLGLFYSYDGNTLDLLTIFSKIFGQNYSFWNFLTWVLFALSLGFYLGAFSLSLENRRFSYYIDLINMAINRKQRTS